MTSLVLNNARFHQNATNAPRKASVQIATTIAGSLSSDFENGEIVDGYTLQTGDRILIKDQADAVENGIYNVAASGNPTRTTDFPINDDIAGTIILVSQGTTNGSTVWLNKNLVESSKIGTDELLFTQVPSNSIEFVASNSTLNTVLFGPNGFTVDDCIVIKTNAINIDGNQIITVRGQAVADANNASASSLTDNTGGTINSTINASPLLYDAAHFDDIHATVVDVLNDMQTDIDSIRTQLNLLLARIRSHGLIAT